MGMKITWDAGEAIEAFINGAQVIYHENKGNKVVPYEMDKNDKVADFASLSGKVAFFIYGDEYEG